MARFPLCCCWNRRCYANFARHATNLSCYSALRLLVLIKNLMVGSSEGRRTSSVPEARGPTGFCGLDNLGTTCYLNSLLQSMFLTPGFRDALFRIRTWNMIFHYYFFLNAELMGPLEHDESGIEHGVFSLFALCVSHQRSKPARISATKMSTARTQAMLESSLLSFK
jgi:hypothetical protein